MIIFMVVGKTSSSISKTEIFDKYSEIEVLTTVFPEITSLPCKICSPFRVDNNPSFSIYMNDQHHICFKDFGEQECRGSLLDLLCKKWNCSFNQVFDKILEVMQKSKAQKDCVTLKPKNLKVLTRKESSELTKIQVVVRPWRSHDIEYWESYGIKLPWLKYAGVHAISHKIIVKEGKKFIFPSPKYSYVFTEYKENRLSLKIYSPFDKNHKWCSKMDSSVISLWTKVPECGDRIVICSSLKDSLCLSNQLHIPAIALQGEGYNMSATAVNELKRRYKKIFICFDIDKPGLADAKKLSEKTGFPFVVPDLNGQKDISDYYKSLEDKQQFKQLETLFH